MCPGPMPLTTADLSIQLLIDVTASLEEIQSRIHARAFAAVMDPPKGPAVRAVVDQLMDLLDATSPDGFL